MVVVVFTGATPLLVVVVVVFFTVVVVAVDFGFALCGREVGCLAAPSVLSLGFALRVRLGFAAAGFVAGALVFKGVGLAEVGLVAVVFGALFGGPASFTSLPGTLEAGGFLVAALGGRAAPGVLVAAVFVGGRAVAALLGLCGFFSWSAFASVVLAAGFLAPATVDVVVFVAGALAVEEGLVAGVLVA